MADETSNPTEHPEGDPVNHPPPPPPPAIEPDGGPFERNREFLDERFARLGPKDQPPAAAAPPPPEPPPPGPLADLAAAEEAPPLPEDFRSRIIGEYRRRQREQLQAEGALPPAAAAADTEEGEEGEEGGGEEDPEGPAGGQGPPEPPQPSPANNWILLGPSVVRKGQGAVRPAVSGRTPAIAVAPGGNRVYIGSANGGVWCSEDEGRSWRSLMNAFDLNPITSGSDSLSCGAIALVPGPTPAQDRIYVGSGEGPGAAYFGVGPIVSFDGGASWLTEPTAPGSPSLAGSAFYALAVDPNNSDRVVAATRAGVYRREPDGAGGFHWARKTSAGVSGNWATSVVAAQSGAVTTFYAARWFGSVFVSTDGDAWSVAGAGFPTTNVGRIGLAVQPNNPTPVYALIHNSSDGSILGVWRFDTGDNTWRPVSGHPADLFGTSAIGFQGSYDLAINVDPNNVNRIYLGGSTRLASGHWSASLYRGDVTSSGAGAGLTYSMSPTYIGASVHADVHTLVFAPGDSNKLWVGCDGGVFYSTNPTGSGNIFQARNTGLATLTMEYLGQHPTEDALLFSGTQDNGTTRFSGEETWFHSGSGDGGHVAVNWNDPYRVLRTYVRGIMERATDGAQGYGSWLPASLPAGHQNNARFYAPLVGTPPNPAAPAQANTVAFGGTRPWISNTFGGSWQSIPNGTNADDLPAQLRSLAFASATLLYGGTMQGDIYRFTQSAGAWSRTQIDTLGGASALPLNGPVTSIAVDPADASGNSVYITFGGSGDYRHVWHFDGAQWQQRSGPSAGHISSLLDVQHNAIVVDPLNPTHLYVGADIGVWRSTDSGATWTPFSHGLPDASVLDLKLHPRRLLRAGTHGRGVFEYRLDTMSAPAVELYVRDTQLDQGRLATVNGLNDPTQFGATVRHWRGPDIKLDTPDAAGQYQFPLTGDITFFDFVDTLNDDFQNVATHATATITTRVYVQVHNRGVFPANGVQVMLLLANASAALPALPAGYQTNVQTGTPINTTNWTTIGIVPLNNVASGSPKIAAFNLTSNLLPPPAMLAGNNHHCVLALLHHTGDSYTSSETNTDLNSRQERKAAHKNLTVVQFIGALPPAAPAVLVVRIHNANLERRLLTSVLLHLNSYPGRVRLFLPRLETDGAFEELLQGLVIGQDSADFTRWAEEHLAMIEHNQAGEHPYHRLWSEQRVGDVGQALESGLMLDVEDHKEARLQRIVMEPDSYHTLFLLLDRPENGRIGESYPLEVVQMDDEKEEVIGALNARIDLVPELQTSTITLRLWSQNWLFGYKIVRASVIDTAQERVLTPAENAAVVLTLPDGAQIPMRWHNSWRSFYHYIRPESPEQTTVVATALLNDRVVAQERLTGL